MNRNARERLLSFVRDHTLVDAVLSRDGAYLRAGIIRPRNTHEPVPTSYAQERLWFLDQFQPASPIYTIPAAVRLPGPLSVSLLERCIEEMVRRHESLRTTFGSVEGRPVQIIAPELHIPVTLVDLEAFFSPSQREAEAQRLAAVESRRPFDLIRGPLLRVMLLRLAAADHVLLLTLHHIISDGWSMGVLLQELSVLYEAYSSGRPSPLAELAIQYADFAQWQRQWLQGEVLDQHRQWWCEQLRGAPAQLELPADHPRPGVATFRGAVELFQFTSTLSEALKQLSQREGVTLFMILLAAFQTLLARYTGQSDIVVGTPIANRTRSELEPLIGFFVNTLVLRTDLGGNPSFRELLARVRENTLGAYAHQDLPFEKLVEDLQPERSLSRNPMFQVMLVLQNGSGSGGGATARGNQGTWPLGTGTSKFDLTLFVMEGDPYLTGAIEYSTDLFEAERIRRLARHFQVLLEAAVANPSQRVWDLPLLSDTERRQLLVEWNRSEAPYPHVCLHQLFEAQVERTPEAVALVAEGFECTYRELNESANRLAHYLRKQGIGPESLVGICLERSPEMVQAVLAVLKAGAAYVPIDPHYPQERRKFMLDDSQCVVLLTSQHLAGCFSWADIPVLQFDRAEELFASGDIGNLATGANSDCLAYLIYTSGSTGRPKGAGVTHRNFANLLAWFTRDFEISSADRILLVSSFSFDLTQKNILAPLAVGARLCLAPVGYFDIDLIRDSIQRHGITLLNCTPSAFYPLVDDFNGHQIEKLKSLRFVFLGGEPISVPKLRSWLRSADCSATVVNTYGPTECADISAFYRITPLDYDLDTVPIGRPVPNTKLVIVDAHLQLSPVGVPGELCVGGAGVGQGYSHQPALTAERFVPSILSDAPSQRVYRTGDVARFRMDGNIEYMGRLDQQVKIRGHRIELREIEIALETHPAVAHAVVIAPEIRGERRLVAYIVPDSDRAAPVKQLARIDELGLSANQQRTELPDGTFVFHMNRRETDFLYREIFEERSYLRHRVAIEPGACIFDVGANIGLFALFVARQASNVTLYGFEPIPPVFQALELNCRLHSIDARLFNYGLAAAEGSAHFTYYPHVSILSGQFADPQHVRETVRTYLENEAAGLLADGQIDELLENRLQTENFVCPLKTISQTIRENAVEHIDLLKVDVEKCEWEVLAGIEACHWPMIRQVVLEVHDVDGRLDRITQELKLEGFDVEVGAEPRLRATGLYNVWAVRPQAQDTKSQVEAAPKAQWSGPDALFQDIHRHLSEQLPEYMIPGEHLFLDALPMSPNGKVDRSALPEPDARKSQKRSEYVEPRNLIEALLVRIWREVLNLDRISVLDNFFELGGHSLLATQAVSRIRSALTVELPLRVLFESKTIADIAVAVSQGLQECRPAVGAEIARRSSVDPDLRLDLLSDEEVSRMLTELLNHDEVVR